jgi:hypothetical protein
MLADEAEEGIIDVTDSYDGMPIDLVSAAA